MRKRREWMGKELGGVAPFWPVIMQGMRKRTWKYLESKQIARAGAVMESRRIPHL